MGPGRAAGDFGARTPRAASYRAVLYGSLAATGRGHMTDKAISDQLSPKPVDFDWRADEVQPYHANAFRLTAVGADGADMEEALFYSVGGGEVQEEGQIREPSEIYPNLGLTSLIQWCRKTGRPYWELVWEKEDSGIESYLGDVWEVMQESIIRGLETSGVLPGGLKLARKAQSFYRKTMRNDPAYRRSGLLYSYALAVSEENAGLGRVVTAPTCGSAGVLPAVLRYVKELGDLNDRDIVRSLGTAGLVGNIVKNRATISGAEGGCQAEVGTACAMAAAAATELLGGTPSQIEYAAEMGLEHHLGLTCDPVKGLVQIPCIERNAAAATRALDCADFALLTDGEHRVSFDEVVQAMKQTGKDMLSHYRETGTGGLARHTKVARDPD